MNDDHAKKVAEIEAVLEDYAEVFEPPIEPLVIPSPADFAAVMAAIGRIDPQLGRFDLAAAIASLVPVI